MHRGASAGSITSLALLAALLLLASPAAPLAAQQSNVTLRRAGADTVHVSPGARGSVAFTLQNAGTAREVVRLAFRSPPSLRLVAEATDLALEPESSSLRIAGFVVADNTPAGTYLLHAGGAGIAADSVFVQVEGRLVVQASVAEAPAMVTAGAHFGVEYRIINAGNVAALMELELRSPGGVAARLDSTTVRLLPGAAAVVTAHVQTPSQVSRAFVHGVSLHVRAAELPRAEPVGASVPDTVSAQATARVEVVPEGRALARRPAAGVPGELRLRVSDDAGAGAPLRVQAAGPLRPGSETRVNLLLNGPTDRYSVFGEAETYAFSVHSPDLSIRLGDQVYALSTLTEPGKAGFGAEGRARLGAVEAGGFVQRDRRGFLPDTQQAAFVRLHAHEAFDFGANFLRSRGFQGAREVGSASARLALTERFVLDGEYGVRIGTVADARTVTLRASGERTSLNVRHLRADTAFGGPYGGAATDAAHLLVRPWGGLRLEGSYDRSSFNRVHLGSQYNVSATTARFLVGHSDVGSIEALHGARTTFHSGRSTHRETTSARARLALRSRVVGLFPSAEAGFVSDRDDAEAAPFLRMGFQAQVRGGGAMLTTSADYSTGPSLYSLSPDERLSAALSASLQAGERMRVRVAASGTRRLGAAGGQTSLAGNGWIERRFANGHGLAAHVRTRMTTGLFGGTRETIALLDYTIPFAIPTGHGERRMGSVRVRILDTETGLPVRGAIAELGGRRIVADSRGVVEFSGLDPGDHYLRLDRSSIGLERVPTQRMPMQVRVEPGRRTDVEIRVDRSASISIRVGLASPSGLRAGLDSEPARDTVGVANALVELTSGTERIQRTTDGRGVLTAADLRPGLWTVTVAAAGIPPFHRLEPDSIVLHVHAGADTTATLTVVPVRRTVQIIAAGDLSDRPDAARDTAAVNLDVGAAAIAPDSAVALDPLPIDVPLPAAERVRQATGRPLPDSTMPGHATDLLPPGWHEFQIAVPAATLVQVAKDVYGEPGLWPRIWYANMTRVPDPEHLPFGLTLKIPPRGPLQQGELAHALERCESITTSAACETLPAPAADNLQDPPREMSRFAGLRLGLFGGYLTGILRQETWTVHHGDDTSVRTAAVHMTYGPGSGVLLDIPLWGNLEITTGAGLFNRGETTVVVDGADDHPRSDGTDILAARLGLALRMPGEDSELVLRRVDATVFAGAAVLRERQHDGVGSTGVVGRANHWSLNLGVTGELPFSNDRFAVHAGIEDHVVFWRSRNLSRLPWEYYDGQGVLPDTIGVTGSTSHVWMLRLGLSARFR